MSKVIEVESLIKRFDKLTAVDNISFSVEQGICFGLLGPNGAGKTTTIEMIEGIVKPTSGSIRLFGQPSRRALFKNIGIQFQNTALPDFLKVDETLKLFASFYDQVMPFDRLVSLCAMEDFLTSDARTLSGGQRQRLLLALALVNDPDLIFLDEPTTGLDPQARRHFWSLIEEIKGQGKSVVLTTHYMDEAQVLCDDIAIMDKGGILLQGSPKKLVSSHFDGVLIQLPKQTANLHDVALTVTERADHLEIFSQDVEVTVQQLLQAGVSLDGLKIHQANLEDLFLKLTGHALRE